MALSSDAFAYIFRNEHPTTSLILLLVLYHLHGKDNSVFIFSHLNSLYSNLSLSLLFCFYI